MPAAPFIAAIAVGSGAAAAIGTAVVGALTAATVSTAVATAIGSGIISAGVAIAGGAKASDVLKSAVIGGVSSFVGASVASSVTSSVANAAAGNAATSSIAASLGKVAGAMAGGGVSSAVGSVLSGKGDPIEALIKGGLTAGLTSGVMEGVRATLSNVPGFDKYDTATGKTVRGEAPAAVQRAVTAGLAAGAMGKDADKAVLNSVLNSVMNTGADLVSRGVKDLSATLKATYDNATKTSTALDSNISRQNEIVKDYTAAADAIEAKRKAIQADLDKYNENKALYDRGEIGVEEVNKYAERVNNALPGYEEERATVEAKLNGLSTELDTLKAELPKLENTLVQQKSELDTQVAEFQKQEEANAQIIAKTVEDTLAAKTQVEQALGAPVTQEQLDAFVKTGDALTAAKDYIDIKTTDLAEAQAAALKEGYRFDPNDPEIVAQFTGVKDEAETLAALQSFADARATTMQEANALYRQTYADIYGPDAAIPDPTEEDLLAFIPQVPTDVASIPENYQNVAEDVVKGRIQDQFSQDLGFEDYQDRSFAQQSLGEERPDSDYWNQFKGTSGVVGVEGSEVAPVQFGLTDEAATFLPQAGTDLTAVAPGYDEQFAVNAEDFGAQPPADQVAFQQPEQPVAAQQPQQFVFDQPEAGFDFDFAGFDQPTETDFGIGTGDVTAGIPGVEVGAPTEMPELAGAQAPTLETDADLTDTQLATAPMDLASPGFGVQNVPFDTSAVTSLLTPADQGVQTAAFQPPNIMSDSDVGDIGLRSLVSTQQGGTSATADNMGLESIADRNLTETTRPDDLASVTRGSATYSALTDQDPTKTIAGSILDDTSEDVRGGIQSDTLYSGKESEVAPSDTLTAKYLNEPAKQTETPADVGLTSTTPTGNDTTTFAEPSATDMALRGTDTQEDPYALDQFLAPLRTEKTTLPVSQEPARAAPTDLRTTMDEDNINWDDWDRMTNDYVAEYEAARAAQNAGGGAEPLLTPDGVDESFLDRLSPSERERYLAMQDPNYQNPLADLPAQDLGISPAMIEEFNKNYNPEGGFGSQWQTVGANRVLIDEEGGGLVVDPTTGETSVLTPEQVQALVANGTLNSGKSGYVAATGGKGDRPGGSGPSSTDKIVSKLAAAVGNAASNPRLLSAIGGAALGAASKPRGINPKGLRSIATGTNPQLVQTGAQGTRGRGGVRYFEKKAEGGAINGYAGGGGLGYLKSAQDGMADKIDATIDNKRPAKLSGGEFVIPADVVSHLGNGNSEAGAKQLYDLMNRVRQARTGTKEQGKQINPKKYLPK